MEKEINFEQKLNESNMTLCFNEKIEDEINYDLCDILFMVDATESMVSYINLCINNCSNIVEQINNYFYNEKKIFKRFRYGAIFYREPIDQKNDVHNIIHLTSNKNEFQYYIKNIEAKGGGDYAEDWNGAYEIALNEIKWSSERNNKIIIHFADASAHGKEFIEPGLSDNHPYEGLKFIKTIKKVAEK